MLNKSLLKKHTHIHTYITYTHYIHTHITYIHTLHTHTLHSHTHTHTTYTHNNETGWKLSKNLYPNIRKCFVNL